MVMKFTFNDAVELTNNMRVDQHRLMNYMQLVSVYYNNDIVVPIPKMGDHDLDENFNPSATLVANAINNNAQRAASVMPTINVPLAPGKTDNNMSVKKADRRTVMYHGVWNNSGMDEVILPRAYRHLNGYASTCFRVVENESEYDYPMVRLSSPLGTYPEPTAPEDFSCLNYCAFVHKKSATWVGKNYPEAKQFLTDPKEFWDILEFHAEDYIQIGLLGPCDQFYQGTYRYFKSPALLRRFKNKAKRVAIVCPQMVTLERIESQIMKMLPTVDALGRMHKYEWVQAEKGLSPTLLAYSEDGQPILIGGKLADGREGNINLLANTRGVQQIQQNPSLVSQAVGDRLEQGFNESVGMDPLFRGEAVGSQLRTGKAINTMANYSLDQRIAEQQKLMAAYLTSLNECIADVNLACYPKKKQYYFSGKSGDRRLVEIIPERDIETNVNRVVYPFPGADISSIGFAIAQRLEMGLLSTDSARIIDPLIADPEFDKRNILLDGMEKQLLQTILEMASAPPGTSPLTITDGTEVAKRVGRGEDVLTVIDDVYNAALARAAQSAQAASQTAPMSPVGLPPMPGSEGATGLPAPSGELPAQAGGGPPQGSPPPGSGNASGEARELLSSIRQGYG
jgi:hypothetical protein